MKEQKGIRGLWILAGIFGALCILLYLEFLVSGQEKTLPTEKVQPLKKDAYNGYGLEGDQELSDVVIFEEDDVCGYVDRVIRRFSYEESRIENAGVILQNLKEQYPSVEQIYVLPVPGRVLLENGYETDKELYQEFLQQLESRMPEWAQVVDVLPELAAHEEEYIFFRTENSWTARGAYYGSSVLCGALGLEPFPLNGYEEYMYNSFEGTLLQKYEEYPQYESFLEEAAEDRVYYYLLPDGKNLEKVEREKGDWVARPVFSQSAGGLATFVAGNYQSAVLEGDQKRQATYEETILLICDDRGKVLAPFLANYYKNVYVINVTGDSQLSEELAEIMAAYEIHSIVWAQSPQELGDSSFSKALQGFLSWDE